MNDTALGGLLLLFMLGCSSFTDSFFVLEDWKKKLGSLDGSPLELHRMNASQFITGTA
jgi:hypothetical protein